MIVIAIIVLLIALVVVAMRGIQNSSSRTRSINSLRQMTAGYLTYSSDHRAHLMPGYVDYDNPAVNLPNNPLPELNARLSNGEWMVDPGATKFQRKNLSSYVWRLMPYVDHNWRVLLTDYRDPGIEARVDRQISAGVYGLTEELAAPGNPDIEATLGTAPAYGLNSIFLGGDNRHGGDEVKELNPWDAPAEKIAATRMSEVRNPRAIIFAPTGMVNIDTSNPDVYETPVQFNQPRGYVELRPPFLEKDAAGVWTERQWEVGSRGRIQLSKSLIGPNPYDEGAGLPIMRRGDGYLPVSRLDGSAEAADIVELSRDMRNWSPFETGLNPPPFVP